MAAARGGLFRKPGPTPDQVRARFFSGSCYGRSKAFATALFAALFQGRLAQPDLGSGTLQQRHQLFAVGTKLFSIETAQVGYPDRRLEPFDGRACGAGKPWVAGLYGIGEDDPIRQLDAVDVALHVVERGRA